MRSSVRPSRCLPVSGSRRIVFLADCHFNENEPGQVERFCRVLKRLSKRHCTVFLIGDFFHLYWGSAMLDRGIWRTLVSCLRSCTRSEPVYLLWGNRDFFIDSTFQQRTGVQVAGEAVLLEGPNTTLYVCHGDQLCRDDVAYHCMKLIIRSPVVKAMWRVFPSRLRRMLMGRVRAVTVKSLDKKVQEHLLPSRDVLKWLFIRDIDVVVSGHRHVKGEHVFPLRGRTCFHYELPPWTEQGEFLLYFQDELCFQKEGEGIDGVDEEKQ